MRIAYCDCYSGISGDMFLAALIDAGLPLDYLIGELSKVGFEEKFSITAIQTLKGAIRGCLLEIQFEAHHAHRHLSDILGMLQRSALDRKVIDRAEKVFAALAEAEARVHGCKIEEVHFHEVGALDSIIDIVGAAIGLEYLGIERLFSSALPYGRGQVKTDHGLLPLPAPATLELMRKGNFALTPSPATKELVTPTGAAILTAFAEFSQPEIKVEALGIGAGKRDLPWPNVMRIIIGEAVGESSGEMVLLETNIDDMNPQLFTPMQHGLFQAGALDVYFSPIFMKKNRPATMVSVIARKRDEAVLAAYMLRETTTLGVRVMPIWRYAAQRKMASVSTRYGTIQVKVKYIDGKAVMAIPEYEDCVNLAVERKVSVIDVYQSAIAAGQEFIQGLQEQEGA